MDVFCAKKGVVKSSDGTKSSFRKEKKYSSGRPNLLVGERLEQLLSVYYSEPLSLRELANMFGVSRMTVWRAVQEPQMFPR